jgi:hypothetical protein
MPEIAEKPAEKPDGKTVAHSSARPPERARETVTVALKHPCGIILRAFRMVPKHEYMMSGAIREYQEAEQLPESVELNGNAINLGSAARGILPEHLIRGGYALTSNVPKELWEMWREQNADGDLVKRELIFAYGDDRDAAKHAVANGSERSGLEPIDQDNPRANLPSMVGPQRGKHLGIEKAERPAS